MTRADCIEEYGSPPECWKWARKFCFVSHVSLARETHHNTLAECTSSIDIGDTWMNMHANRHPTFDKYLLEEHPGNFTCLDISVRYEVSVRSVSASPAETKAFLLRGSRLNENISLSWYFRLDTAAKGLAKQVVREAMLNGKTVTNSNRFA